MDAQKFFAELEDRKSEFGISDIQLGLATLEEVFLNIARQAELETATAEGRLATLTLTSGASVEVKLNFAMNSENYFLVLKDNKFIYLFFFLSKMFLFHETNIQFQ